MMQWHKILAMYEEPMAEDEFAAFLIRRFHFLNMCVNCKWIKMATNPHVLTEYQLCSTLINRLTEKPLQEVLQKLNNHA